MYVVVASLLSLLCVSALPLPKCTVGVVGANGRVGSMVCRELLRNHPEVTVRALVRTATDTMGYSRLSYEIGAEDGKQTITPAWSDNGRGGIGGTRTMEFDEKVQGGYGLDRLNIRECEVRYKPDVEDALGDVDAVVYCASSFDRSRNRLPDGIGGAVDAINRFGLNLFTLNFGERQKDNAAERKEAARGKTADAEGLENVLSTLRDSFEKKRRISALVGGSSSANPMDGLPKIVAVSAASQLIININPFDGSIEENEFGFFKRQGEMAIKDSGLDAIVVRSAAIDEVRSIYDKEVNSILTEADDSDFDRIPAKYRVSNDEANKRRIHPKDLARYLVKCLSGDALKSAGATKESEEATSERASKTAEVWTYEAAGPLSQVR